uniref:Uncharacterized protein n=1 Tax=viral metagenome TaxID=1070528 RepID=A0A6M3JPJ2_9ZZZZ
MSCQPQRLPYPTNFKVSNYDLTDTPLLTKTEASLHLYVETTGSDVTGDGSVGNPYATTQKAVGALPDALNNDCYIHVGAGTYTGTTIIRKLTTKSDNTVTPKYLFIVGDPTELLAEQTAEGGTRNTITDTGAFTGVNYAGKFVEILAGPNFIDTSTYYWYKNIFPIRSNTDDVLTLGCTLSSLFTNATHYRIIENATIIEGDGSSTHFGLTNYSSTGVEVHVQSIEFRKTYFGVNNYGRAWVQGCSFVFDTTGYSGVMGNHGSDTLIDGNYATGVWINACFSNNSGNYCASRWNYCYNGKSGFENDSGTYFFSYGCVVDTMTDYGAKAVNSGIIKGSDSINTGTEYSNCAKQAFYAVIGGKISENNATGSGNAEIARVIAASDVFFNSSRITATNLFTFDDNAGRIIDKNTGIIYTGSNYGGKGSVLISTSSTEEIIVPALSASAASSASLIPAGSIVKSVVARVIETTAAPVTNFDVGRTSAGNLDEYVMNKSIALNTTARSTVDGDGTFTGAQINAAADTITITLDGATGVGDPCTIRVTVYYDLEVAPTS